MSILIAAPGRNPDPWIRALKQADPKIKVVTLDQPGNKEAVRLALAWDHPEGIFSGFPKLGCISSMGAGVDHLVTDTTIPEHIEMVRIIDPTLSQDLFEFALAIIMGENRTLDQFKENQAKGLWKKKRYARIKDTSVGILGTGIIGNHVATQLAGLGFRVCGWGRTGPSGTTGEKGHPLPYKRYFGQNQLGLFLQSAGILICLLPLTEETRGILNRKHLSQLPRGASLINLGRGAHLVDEDLVELLDSGHLSGASLDVFSPEPLPAGHPFWGHSKIRITPHIASLTDPESVAPQIIENHRRLLQGKPLLHRVNRQRGY